MVARPFFMSPTLFATIPYLCSMICIDIEYRSWWWPFTRRVRGFAPTRWWEMDESHFIAVVRTILGDITEDEYWAALFGLPRRIVAQLDPWHRHVLGQQLKWMETGKSESSRFFIRRIGRLLAPDDALGSMSLQQFMTVDTFFIQYTDTISDEKPRGDVARLCRMVAALYLRPGETYFAQHRGDRVADIEGNARILIKAPLCKTWGVYLNWVMIRNWLSRAYPMLFPESDDDKNSTSDTSAKNDKKNEGKRRTRKLSAWLDTFDSFMGNDIAHLDTYRKMAATDAFRLMNKRIRNAAIKK